MIPVVPDYDRVAANSVTEAGARALQALQRPLIIDQQQPGLDPNPGFVFPACWRFSVTSMLLFSGSELWIRSRVDSFWAVRCVKKKNNRVGILVGYCAFERGRRRLK